jgi:acyl-CoA hydrolase
VTYVGRTSIEVRCDTYLEDLESGMRHSINRAFLTEVCVDKEGHPTPVPYGLKIESVAEQARYEGALNRIKMRKLAVQEGF